MIAHFLGLIIIPLLLVAAGVWDLARYTIPNSIPLLLALLFVACALGGGITWMGLSLHAATGLIVLLAGFVMFAFGWIGGGDAKLFAVIAMIMGPTEVLQYTLIAAIFGGGLTLALLLGRQLPLPAPLAAQGWILRLHDARQGVPYGVALSAAALLVLSQQNILRLITG